MVRALRILSLGEYELYRNPHRHKNTIQRYIEPSWALHIDVIL